MKIESSVKHDQIVEAALKRFSHFGIAKTTLTEVADDMLISKQVLSYYFPDKQSLIQAVTEKLTYEFLTHLETEIVTSHTVEEALLKHTQVKAFFFKKYFLLITQADNMVFAVQGSFDSWRTFLKEKESELLAKLFERGVETGELKPLDTQKTADLFLDTLYAFSRCVKEKGDLPDAEAFQQVLHLQQEVIQIFYQGLKAGAWTKEHPVTPKS